MTALNVVPPPQDAIAAMTQIPGIRIGPTMLVTQNGVLGDCGPEEAGAILILQATFSDEERAHGFWDAAVPLMAMLASAPGFIRRYSFFDGPSVTLIALWRTVDDAKAFGASTEHRAAVHNLYRQRWQYSHFSAIWEMTSNNDRMIFCDECDGIAAASEGACPTCGTAFVNPYATL